jgi:GntR family transcriptional regulator
MAAMRFWFARSSSVSLHEQLVTQVLFGIVSGELSPGSRLPSTREMARRFRIHPNTISSGYQQLEADGWVQMRPGSGVFVRDHQPAAAMPDANLHLDPRQCLDQLIGGFLRSARQLGVSNSELRARLDRWLSVQPPDHFLVVEPDEEMRRILMAEIAATVPQEVHGCSIDELRRPGQRQGAIAVAVPSKAVEVRAALPPEAELVTLKIRSVPSSLASYLPLPRSVLIGVASGWPRFLESAQTMLTAAGIHSDSLLLCSTHEPDWQRGLEQTIAVVTDPLTARSLPAGCRVIAFALIAEESLEELKRLSRLLTETTVP